MIKLKSRMFLAVVFICPFIFFVASICIGRYPVSVALVFKAIWQAMSKKNMGVSSDIFTIVNAIRIPRAFLCVLVGASLSASGTAFQGIFRNPLVSSGVLGVSSGAGFGAALAILLFSNTFMTPLFAFVFGVAAVLFSFFAGRINNVSTTITLVLGGVIVQSIFSALLSLTKYVADPTNQLPTITFWLMGSLASTRTSDLVLSGIPMVAGMAGLLMLRFRLNVLSMGDKEAATLGIHVQANKFAVIAFATLATAGAVSVSGVVGWVGLVIPHIGRMLVGNDNRKLMPISMALGACFVLLVDTICRTITGSEIPLGIVTALIGGPFFVYLLKKTKGGNW